MKNRQLKQAKYFLLFPLYFFLFTSTAKALPGEKTETVAAWINAHPTLRPGVIDGLRVRKSETAAQQFTFKASILPPGELTLVKDKGTIRHERLAFYDQINGVTFNRLQESLRVIYGLAVYQDYQRARLVYDYPAPETIDLARRQDRPLLAAQEGQLLLGDRYAYWMEITNTESGKAFYGHLTIFQKEYLDKLETQLRDR